MIYIASTFNQRVTGFQYRNEIDKNEAMLFKKIGSGASFHMRNVGTSLAIASLDSDYKVINTHIMEPEIGSYTSAHGTDHVLEAHPDFFSHYGIKSGVLVRCILDEVGYDKYDWNYFYKLAKNIDTRSLRTKKSS